MKNLKNLFFLLTFVCGLLVFAGCDDGDDVSDEMEDATEEMGDAMEDTANDVEDAVD